MNGIDPRFAQAVNLAVMLLAALAGAGAEFTTIFGDGPTKQIMAGIGLAGVLVGAVNAWLHNQSAPVAGPGVK